MVHDKIELDRWIEIFPLKKLRQEARDFVVKSKKEDPSRYATNAEIEGHVKLMSPGGERITSPVSLAIVEQLRTEALKPGAYKTVATDVFVFGKGEPENRAATKVGGVPYRQATRPWPKTDSGEPMMFVGQFCFADSKDIVGKLPGDILLIFSDGQYWAEESIYFEWANIGSASLIKARSIPKTEARLTPCYGNIHRTVDYLGAEKVLKRVYNSPSCIESIEGTKIGGTPRLIQKNDPPASGRFLCALGSVEPTPDIIWPFTNVKKPFDYSAHEEKNEGELLMWGDAGSLYIFIDEAGHLTWNIQGY